MFTEFQNIYKKHLKTLYANLKSYRKSSSSLLHSSSLSSNYRLNVEHAYKRRGGHMFTEFTEQNGRLMLLPQGETIYVNSCSTQYKFSKA